VRKISNDSEKKLSDNLAHNFKKNVNEYRSELPISPDITTPISLSTANRKEILQTKVHEAMKKLQLHPADTGSSQVQIAVLTEKIKSLAAHFAQHRKDYSSSRGYWAMINRRRIIMNYLKKTDFQTYKVTVELLGLEKEDRKHNRAN